VTVSFESWFRGLQVPGKPDEHESKSLLAAGGLRVPRRFRLEPGDERAPAIDPPCVVKVCSPEILHKTDREGVLMAADQAGLQGALRKMSAGFPGCRVLVEEKVAIVGPEFILGAFRDPSFGLAVMAGAGGILTELYQDVAFRLVPCDTREARRMLQELRVFPVLAGYRGLSMDADGLADVIARVSAIVTEIGERFVQMDINPIVFTSSGWTVLDAKLILRTTAA
jgi:hypothetical protein